MKIVNDALLRSFRLMSRCEYCQRFRAVVGHHLWSRGAGRIDLPINLIGLCHECHQAFHDGHLRRADFLAVVAQREGLLQDDIQQEIWRIRALPKEAEYEAFAGQGPRPVRADHQHDPVSRGPHQRRPGRGAGGLETDEGWQAFGDV